MNLNAHFKDFFADTKRYLVSSGGAGAGKSVCAAQKLILRCVQEVNPKSPHIFLVIRKSAATNAVSTYQLLCSLIRQEPALSSTCIIKKAPMEINFANGNKITFGGLNDAGEVEKIKSIAGISGMWIEEANQISSDGFKQLDLRLRGETQFYKQIILTFNPVSTFNWIYSYFFSEATEYIRDNCTKIHSTYLNNPFIDSAYSKQLSSYAEVDINYYNVYCLGQWGSIDNTVYRPFSFSDVWPTRFDETIYGIDFGFNHPSVLLKIGIYDGSYYIHECIYESNLTRNEFFDKLAHYIDDKYDTIYADSAEPASIQELKNRGYSVQSANKSVNEGINYIKSIHARIFTNVNNTNFNRENVTYMYKQINGKLTEIPVKINDDAMDAMRYAIFTHTHSNNSFEIAWTSAKNLF